MLFNTAINMKTSTSMNYNTVTSTLCFLFGLLLLMINNTLSNIANINAHNSIITPSTTTVIEIGMVNAILSLYNYLFCSLFVVVGPLFLL